MTQIAVLPAALSAASRAVQDAVPEASWLTSTDLGDGPLTAALDAYLESWSCAPLTHGTEDAARSLAAGAQEYADVESLLVPRAPR